MITKYEIDNIIQTNGIVFVNDLVDYFDTSDLIEIINKLHNMGINNIKSKNIFIVMSI